MQDWVFCQASIKPSIKVIAEVICGGGGGGGDIPTPNPDVGGPGNIGGGPGGTPTLPLDYPNPQTNPEEYQNGITQPINPNLNNVNLLPKTPCGELAKISANSSMITKLTDLKENHTNDEEESGYSITKNNITGNYNTPTTAYPSPSQPDQIYMPFGNNNIGTLHTHIRASMGYPPMFSDGDLYYLYGVAFSHNNNGLPKDFSEYFLTITTPSGTFAIKIKNPGKLHLFIKDPAWNGNSLSNLTNKYEKRSVGSNIKDYQRDLLNLLLEMDAGIGLYEASSDFSSWKELSLNPDNLMADIIETPCN